MKIQRAIFIHFVNLALGLASAISLNSLLVYKDYNLYENGKWASTKAQSTKALLAAWTMLYSKPGVSQNHLNISAWHGYQELIYKKALKFETVGFNCRSFGRPFSFILNKTDTGSTGVYFNYDNDTCCVFTSDAEGKFIEKKYFKIGHSLNNPNWNQVQCRLKNGQVSISVNKNVYAEIKTDLPDSVHIGFRGSGNDIYIDDIIISDARQKTFLIDDFTPPFSVKWITLVFLIILIICYLYIAKRHSANFILLNAVILCGILIYARVYFYDLSGLYPTDPNPKYLIRKECKIEGPGELNERLSKIYPLHETAGHKPVILFVGSSQTWGAGMSDSAKAYPHRIEQYLRAYFNNEDIVVINTGICGFTSDQLLALYKSEWVKYKPLLTVIDLSNNDFDTAVFRKSTRGFIDENQSRNIKTLLILEPNDKITARLLYNHEIMKAEAIRVGIDYEEEQSYMDSCSHSGFLWWDFVHMTDYGYHVFAERLTLPVINILESDSTINHGGHKLKHHVKAEPYTH